MTIRPFSKVKNKKQKRLSDALPFTCVIKKNNWTVDTRIPYTDLFLIRFSRYPSFDSDNNIGKTALVFSFFVLNQIREKAGILVFWLLV